MTYKVYALIAFMINYNVNLSKRSKNNYREDLIGTLIVISLKSRRY